MTTAPAVDADGPLVGAKGANPFGDTSAGEGENQQRNRGADGERECELDRPATDPTGGSGDGDRREDRAGARNVNGAQRQPEDETAAVGADAALRDPGERLLQQGLELWDDHAQAEQHQHHQPDPADGVRRDGQRPQDDRSDQREDAEAQRTARRRPSTAAGSPFWLPSGRPVGPPLRRR